MFAKPMTIKAATELWVSQFNAINQDIIARLMKYEPNTWREVTIPVVGDAVYHRTAKATGEIIEYDELSGDYLIRLVYSEKKIYARAEELESIYTDSLPMWSTMWSFGESIDDYWLDECGGVEAMSKCGFRVYKHDEFGYYFGINGAGYDFYEAHWIPLYRARGLEWHKS